jgi:4-carboxymuconolactone decarboxylase
VSTLTGSEQIARTLSENMGSRGAMGQIGHYSGFGGIWGRNELSRRDRSLVVISFQAAFGRKNELRFHVNGGLNHGLTIEEVDGVILQISTYARAAAGIDAGGVVAEVIGQREGTETRSTPPAPLELKDPETRRADSWSRPQLSRRDRSIVVVSALAALGLERELEIHLQGALNHGVTRTELEEIMITLTLYGGFPRAIDGLMLAHKVFERADANDHTR